jgi:hypothetical protein
MCANAQHITATADILGDTVGRGLRLRVAVLMLGNGSGERRRRPTKVI